MGYDLGFWKYKKGATPDHQQVYEKLSDGLQVDGLEELPIPQFQKRVDDVFASAGWVKHGESSWDSDKGAFQVYTTNQFFRISCYGMKNRDMNSFIDIALEFGCPLFDPQTGERFNGIGN